MFHGCFRMAGGTPIAGGFFPGTSQQNLDDDWGYPYDLGTLHLQNFKGLAGNWLAVAVLKQLPPSPRYISHGRTVVPSGNLIYSYRGSPLLLGKSSVISHGTWSQLSC